MVGILANSSMTYLPTMAAWKEVPQATILMELEVHVGQQLAVLDEVQRAEQRVVDGVRLLEYLLEHEVLETALLGVLGGPGDHGGLAFYQSLRSESKIVTSSGVIETVSPSMMYRTLLV